MTLRRGSNRRLPLVAAVMVALALSGCDSSREKAEAHLEAARTHLEQNDPQAAISELRAALRLRPKHRDARTLLASTLYGKDRPIQAAREYHVLTNYHPNDIEGLQGLALAAISFGDWILTAEALERLEKLAPSDPTTLAIKTALDFKVAARADDDEARYEAVARARDLKASLPGNLILRLVIIDSLLQDGDDRAALIEIDAALDAVPTSLALYQRKLKVIHGRGNVDETEALLKEMVEVLPRNPRLQNTMLRFYVSSGRLDEAESFLRSGATDETASVADRTALVGFLAAHRGIEAAIKQCDAFIATGDDTSVIRILRASYLFDAGQEDMAIDEMETLLATLDPGSPSDQAKLTLARMLLAQNNSVGARALIEEILEHNPAMIGALILRASELIQLDRTEEALRDLDLAAKQTPNNPSVMETRADAFIRLGETTKALESLAAAVDASGGAPEQSLRYANLLVQNGQVSKARDVVGEAVHATPNNLPLLAEAGRLSLLSQDWSTAEDIERHLRELAQDDATEVADRLRASLLYQQDRQDDALVFLEELARNGDQNLGVQVAILRTHLSRGDKEDAKAYADQLLARSPDDSRVRFVFAAVLAATGEVDQSRDAYRALIADGAGGARASVELARLEIATERPDAAEAILKTALAAHPQDAQLQWIWTNLLQQMGRHDEAIAALEALYEQNSATDFVANNLASLLSTYRTDEESLEQAYRISRRLRDSSVPQYADTYGWIAYLRGDYAEAVRHLEQAAPALPEEPSVQIHLAMAYLALDRNQDAAAAFRRALEVSGDSGSEAAETARRHLEELQ